jgi:uncharacterized protein YecT (DUF1311 family)
MQLASQAGTSEDEAEGVHSQASEIPERESLFLFSYNKDVANMAKRNYVEEILSIRLRNELNPRWGAALTELRALEHALEKAQEFPREMVRYFPIAMVATIEAYFRSAVKELIDLGPPFSERAVGFDKARDLLPDFRTVLAIQGKTITVGDLVGHLLPVKSLEDIDRNMTTIMGESFLDKLKSTQDRWAIEIEGAVPKPIIDNPSEVYQGVKQMFRLRHIYCHEVAPFETVDIGLIMNCFVNSSLFLKAADQLIWNLVAPGAPLDQSAMNAQAFQDFKKADKELEELCANIALYLNDEEKKEFEATQDAWTSFRELGASSYASRWGRRGSIWPTLNSSEAHHLTRSRIEELKRELEHLRRQRSYRLKEA